MDDRARGFVLEVLTRCPLTGEMDPCDIRLLWEPPFPEGEEEIQLTAERVCYFLLGTELGEPPWAIYSHSFEEVDLGEVDEDFVLRITEDGWKTEWRGE